MSRKKTQPAAKKTETVTLTAAQFNALQSRYIQAREQLKASYDAARNGDEYKNIWANADRFDADSANNRQVRLDLMSRSRYEINNNAYSDGIAQTYATDLIGCGPTLRMQTASQGFNRMVEDTWDSWCKATKFRRKLWCMAHAKHSDGEAFAVIRKNSNLNHKVQIDLVLHEADQCQTPYLPFGEPGRIDGVKFDQFGNPVYYEFLQQHPGDATHFIVTLVPERVPAQFVLHWFKLRRPGQHRAVPESCSSLNMGAASRRWREAILAKAETQADFTVFLKTEMSPDEMDPMPPPMSTLDIQKRMMTALPSGYDISQLDNNTPGASFEGFHKALINEMARPKSMPFNKAACDSSSYNYASGRLDHSTYYGAIDVERDDCDDVVLDPLFSQWFDLAVMRYRWLGGDPATINEKAKAHLWDWPRHQVADVESEANANTKRLTSGQVFLPQLYAESGLDLDDEIAKAAAAFGVDENVIRLRLLDMTMPPQPAKAVAGTPGTDQMPPEMPGKPAAKPPAKTAAESVLEKLNGRMNGATHAN